MPFESIKALLVEDNPDDAVLLSENLAESRQVKVHLTLTQRLDEAVQLVLQEEFEIILLDLSLPDSQGLQTVERMLKAAPGLPVVVLTGLADEEMGLAAVKAGAQDYFFKSRAGASELIRGLRYAMERHRLTVELKEALAKVKTLTGMLPICSNCKKIRDDQGYWQAVELYLAEHSGATLSHGMCPDCIRELYPDMAEQIIKSAEEEAAK